MSSLSLIVPGDLATQTGGYIYDRRIVDGLRRIGRDVDVHSLDSSFPHPTPDAVDQARAVLQRIPSGRTVVIDGLALGGLSPALEPESERLSLVALIHHPLSLETGLAPETATSLRTAERASVSLVRRVVVTSQWTSRVALKEYGISADRIHVVEPGVDPVPSISRRPHDTDPAMMNLLSVATITPRKGHSVLIDALARIRDRNWRLRCVGSLSRDPATVEALRNQIHVQGLNDKIELVGEVSDELLQRYYADSDVFVLASFMEGYGMALTEAIAHGVPIVATRAGAIPETVPIGSILVEPGDHLALARALTTLMDDSVSWHRLAAQAKEARNSLLSWETAARKFAAALEGLEGVAK